MRWCDCDHDDAEHLDEGICEVCGEPERTWFVGAVLAQVEDLDREHAVEVLEEALEEASNEINGGW